MQFRLSILHPLLQIHPTASASESAPHRAVFALPLGGSKREAKAGVKVGNESGVQLTNAPLSSFSACAVGTAGFRCQTGSSHSPARRKPHTVPRVLASGSPFRAVITPRRRSNRLCDFGTRTEPQKRCAVFWIRRLKRVFRIDIEKCIYGSGIVNIPVRIQAPGVIPQILEHLKQKTALALDRTPQVPRILSSRELTGIWTAIE